jgi:hypothetical protein
LLKDAKALKCLVSADKGITIIFNVSIKKVVASRNVRDKLHITVVKKTQKRKAAEDIRKVDLGPRNLMSRK